MDGEGCMAGSRAAGDESVVRAGTGAFGLNAGVGSVPVGLLLALLVFSGGCAKVSPQAVPEPVVEDAAAVEAARFVEEREARARAEVWLAERRRDEFVARDAAEQWAERAAQVARELAAEQAAAQAAVHEVRRGDTLWALAGLYLSNPFDWPRIWEANRAIVTNPHLIFPEQRLVIPAGVVVPAGVVGAVAAEWVVVDREEVVGGLRRTRFYVAEPGAAQQTPERVAGLLQLEGGLVLPAVQAVEFRSSPWLSWLEDLDVVGRLVGVRELADKRWLAESVHPFDRIVLTYGVGPRPALGDRLLLVHEGRDFRGRGKVIEPRAEATVVALDADVFAAVVVRQFGLLESGALAVPSPPVPPNLAAESSPVVDGPAGTLIGFAEEMSLYGPASRAFIDLGRADGVGVGDDLVVFVPARVIDGERFPAEPVAWARVVRVVEGSSTVRFLRVFEPALAVGMPVRVVSRIR